MADTGGKTSAPLLVAAQMREIEAQVRTCQLCKLARTRTNAVPGEGDYGAEVMFIGEGPGYHEDRQGRPFVGNAGQFLNELLGIAGLSRREVFIANVVKCRPPNNRDPMPDEISACASYLDRQIELINPRIIVTLGRYSMARFFPGERISQIHGKARVIDGRLCVAMYHPAAGLHQASLADVIRADFRLLAVIMEQRRKILAPSAPSTPAPAVEDEPLPTTLQPNAVEEQKAEYQAAEKETQSGPTTEPALEASAPRLSDPKKRATKSKEKEAEYTQLPLFDL